jgi:hypothetical protein
MPHYVLDCHEMGPLDTYLFSPPREPFNPYMTSYIHKWWGRVAKAHAQAFDRYGWSYYTREWNEELYPGYGSSWSIYLGAVGFLFEQAGVDGSQIKQPDGTVRTYRETVHHQFIGSMVNECGRRWSRRAAQRLSETEGRQPALQAAHLRVRGGAESDPARSLRREA